jgi:hypothetical protein
MFFDQDASRLDVNQAQSFRSNRGFFSMARTWSTPPRTKRRPAGDLAEGGYEGVQDRVGNNGEREQWRLRRQPDFGIHLAA